MRHDRYSWNAGRNRNHRLPPASVAVAFLATKRLIEPFRWLEDQTQCELICEVQGHTQSCCQDAMHRRPLGFSPPAAVFIEPRFHPPARTGSSGSAWVVPTAIPRSNPSLRSMHTWQLSAACPTLIAVLWRYAHSSGMQMGEWSCGSSSGLVEVVGRAA